MSEANSGFKSTSLIINDVSANLVSSGSCAVSSIILGNVDSSANLIMFTVYVFFVPFSAVTVIWNGFVCPCTNDFVPVPLTVALLLFFTALIFIELTVAPAV